jgi:dolichol-phosphate mannosyltransferase
MEAHAATQIIANAKVRVFIAVSHLQGQKKSKAPAYSTIGRFATWRRRRDCNHEHWRAAHHAIILTGIVTSRKSWFRGSKLRRRERALSELTPQSAPAPAEKPAARTLVAVATYNEIENLPPLVDEIFLYAPQVDLLVIDDNSPDGTGAWADTRAAGDPRVRCLHRGGKFGLGAAVVDGMRYAVEREYDYLVNMDADFSHHPRHLPELIAGMEGERPVDVMVGSRYISGGGVEGWPIHRRVMSRCVNLYARAFLGLPVKDCSGSFRCYRVSLLKKLDFGAIRSRGYSFFEEILWRLKRLGARFRETPIVFADRERGHSKINRREAVEALRIIALLGAKNWTGRNP